MKLLEVQHVTFIVGRYQAFVQLEDTVLQMGGRYATSSGATAFSKNMFKFDPATTKFVRQTETLRQPVYGGVAVMVDAGWLGCKNK